MGAPTCPQCGCAMVARTNRAKGNQFWGCVTYPHCKGTREMRGNEPLRVEVDCVQIGATLDSVQAAADRLALSADVDTRICVRALSAMLEYVLMRKQAEDPDIWYMLDQMDRRVRKSEFYERKEFSDERERDDRREDAGRTPDFRAEDDPLSELRMDDQLPF